MKHPHVSLAQRAAELRDSTGRSAHPYNAQGLRTDGPTVEQWVAAGYPAERYPPQGYAVNTVRYAFNDRD